MLADKMTVDEEAEVHAEMEALLLEALAEAESQKFPVADTIRPDHVALPEAPTVAPLQTKNKKQKQDQQHQPQRQAVPV